MSSSKTLTERLEAAHRRLRGLRRRLQLGNWITAIIGFALLLLVAGYFAYGYSQISDLRDPELIVSLVGGVLDQNIPEVRKTLEEQVKTNASVWAEQASEQVLLAMPTIRKGLEDYACKQADALIDELDVVGEKEFRRLLDKNRSTVKQAIQDLKDEKEVSDGVVLLLEEAMEKELQIPMQDQAEVLLVLLSDLNKNIKQLHEGENLSAEQQCERRVLMIAKRLQVEQFGDASIEELSPPVVKDLVEELERTRLQKRPSSASTGDTEPSNEKRLESETGDKEEPKDEKPTESQKDAKGPPADQKADEPKTQKADQPETQDDQAKDSPE